MAEFEYFDESIFDFHVKISFRTLSSTIQELYKFLDLFQVLAVYIFFAVTFKILPFQRVFLSTEFVSVLSPFWALLSVSALLVCQLCSWASVSLLSGLAVVAAGVLR